MIHLVLLFVYNFSFINLLYSIYILFIILFLLEKRKKKNVGAAGPLERAPMASQKTSKNRAKRKKDQAYDALVDRTAWHPYQRVCGYETQQRVFRDQLLLAHELGRPVSVHCVKARVERAPLSRLVGPYHPVLPAEAVLCRLSLPEPRSMPLRCPLRRLRVPRSPPPCRRTARCWAC